MSLLNSSVAMLPVRLYISESLITQVWLNRRNLKKLVKNVGKTVKIVRFLARNYNLNTQYFTSFQP